ncbi:MAG TPA: LPXTG cell wall anchor domain-containing protein [Acidimicrobiales bacterium]|nr:LPXTG cell wall anchor domain-containing protein [Acidimicrobiales bacterium]
MGRSPLATRATLIAATMVFLAGVVTASIPGLLAGTKHAQVHLSGPIPSTTIYVPPTTTPPPPPSTTVTTQPPVSAAPQPAVFSQPSSLPKTGSHTGNLVAAGLDLLMLGGVLVLSQRPEPYRPRHRARRTRRSRSSFG